MNHDHNHRKQTINRTSLLIPLFILLSLAAWSQEICNNGIDDDGDGFIDCYDKKCLNQSACTNFFIKDTGCEARPDTFDTFAMKLKYQSDPATTNPNARPATGDIDQDGKTEIVIPYDLSTGWQNANSGINIFQVENNNLVLKRNIPVNTYNGKKVSETHPNFRLSPKDIVLADIDRDGCAEIFVFTYNGNLLAYNCQGQPVWDAPFNFTSSFAFPYSLLGIADFDGDGKSELYFNSTIIDAHSGQLLAQTNYQHTADDIYFAKFPEMNASAGVAVDIDPNYPGLELVNGLRIYRVDINRTGTSSITLIQENKAYTAKMYLGTYSVAFTPTSVADFNRDGYLDILAIGSLKGYSPYTWPVFEYTKNDIPTTSILFWDVHNNILKTYTDPENDNWPFGAGRVNIADIDGDNALDAVYVSGPYLYAVHEGDSDLELTWREPISENTSGMTGCTMFDFNADGSTEIVYRDEDNLYIYSTSRDVNGQRTVLRSNPLPCASRTFLEYPVVADLDNDGATEICVACSSEAITLGKDLTLSSPGQLRIYESANKPWVPARSVWNQHGYFIVNVDDNLQIPRHQQAHHLIYSTTSSCHKDGIASPMNTFLNQAPFLNSDGCPSYPSYNFKPVGGSVAIQAPTCPDTDIKVSFRFLNAGAIAASGKVPISYYKGNPFTSSARLLATSYLQVNAFAPGDTVRVPEQVIAGDGTAFQLFIVVNDAGTSTTMPIAFPNSALKECDYQDNVLNVKVSPVPPQLIADKLSDDKSCNLPGTGTHFGALQAYINDNGVKNVSDFNFYWTAGRTPKPAPADANTALLTQQSAGTYRVYAVHKTAQCASDTLSLDILLRIVQPQVGIDTISMLTHCEIPDGHLQAYVLDDTKQRLPTPYNGYTFNWYRGTDIFTSPIISTYYDVPKLSAGNYTVQVFHTETGCNVIKSANIKNLTVIPTVTASAEDIICSDLNSGRVQATVDGITAGYTFQWYKGPAIKPTPDFTTAQVDNLPQNQYTVVAQQTSSGCASSPVTVRIQQTVRPVIAGFQDVHPQISCDDNFPLGSATVVVSGNIADYTIQWYSGQRTSSTSLIPDVNSTRLAQVAAGWYTVLVTDTHTGCSSQQSVEIRNEVVQVDALNFNVHTQTSCTNPDGSIQVTSMTVDNTSDYTFHWFNETRQITLTETSATLGLATAGTYSVYATHNVRKCITSAKTIEIPIQIPVIHLAQTDLIPPTSCASGQKGTLAFEASAAGNVAGFRFDWFVGSVAGTAVDIDPTDVSTSKSYRKSNLVANLYAIQVTNLDNGCTKDTSVMLNQVEAHQFAPLKTKVTPITNCVPGVGGNIEVTLTNLAPGLQDSDYDIQLFRQAFPPDSPDDGMPTGGTPLTSLGSSQFTTVGSLYPDYYTVIAIARTGPTAGYRCKTSATVRVEKITTNPSIDLLTTRSNTINNTNCNTKTSHTGNGTIALVLNDPPPFSPAHYNFQWSNGETTQQISNLKPGHYAVRVTFNSSAPNNQGCYSDAAFTVLNHEDVLSLASASDLTTQDVTHCGPDGIAPAPEGSAIVHAIRVNNTPTTDFTDYTFDWRRADETVVTDTDGNGVAADLLSILNPGEYYVSVVNNKTSCQTSLSFSINNTIRQSTSVVLQTFQPEIRCINPIAGSFKVSVSGISLGGYQYQWYRDNVPLPGETADSIHNLHYMAATPNEFKVEVTNTDNQCKLWDQYTLLRKVNPIILNAYPLDLTYCINPNGAVHADVMFGGYAAPDVLNPIHQYNFDFHFLLRRADGTTQAYTMQNPANQLNQLGPEVLGKNIEVYAVDQLDTGADRLLVCQSEIKTVQVADARKTPVVVATGTSPSETCDIALSNGTAEASADHDILRYQFDWFAGDNTTGAPVAQGPFAANLKPYRTPDFIFYTAKATNIETGCAGVDTARVTYRPLPVPVPSIKLLSIVTNCEHDNGALSASVGGDIVNYIFDWYGSRVKATPDHTGSTYEQLAEGTYTVTATAIQTGCTSDPVQADVPKQLVFPSFTYTTTAATCAQDDGRIQLVLNSNTPVRDVIWKTPEGIRMNDLLLRDAVAGTYEVTLTSLEGCASSQTLDLLNEIVMFNGVSRNGDGKNDRFHIDCIEGFPNNVVRIFNRAGTLVYEGNGYDNNQTVFDGYSNRGISLMGTKLPDGTYFYIIDKGDGSKPKGGYLEIVN